MGTPFSVNFSWYHGEDLQEFTYHIVEDGERGKIYFSSSSISSFKGSTGSVQAKHPITSLAKFFCLEI